MKPAGDERTPDGSEQAATSPAREQLMSLWSVERADALVLEVEGEVDGLTAPRLRAAIADAFERLETRPLVVNLSAVRFLGSAGLRMLFDSAAEAVHQRGSEPLRIVVDHTRPVIRPIQIVGLDKVLALYTSVGDALAH